MNVVVNQASTPETSRSTAPSTKFARGCSVYASQKINSGQCQRYSEYAIEPSATSGFVASSRLTAGSRPSAEDRCGSAIRLAPLRMNNIVAPTGTNAHGPGNSLTPSMRAPHDRMAANAMTATVERSHIGHLTYGTTAPTRAPSSNSQPLAKLL